MWYDMLHPAHSTQLVRDKSMHDKRRRTAWDRAFNAKGKMHELEEEQC